jgi:hypothetical protein
VGLAEEAYSWFDGAVDAPKNHMVATLPADGWHLLAELLFHDVFGPRGFARPNTPAYKRAATREIQGAVNVRRLHPATQGRGVVGEMTEHLTGWRPHTWGTVKRFIPFRREMQPYRSDHFVFLAPTYRSGFTIWKSADPRRLSGADARLGEEQAHLCFCIEVQTDR